MAARWLFSGAMAVVLCAGALGGCTSDGDPAAEASAVVVLSPEAVGEPSVGKPTPGNPPATADPSDNGRPDTVLTMALMAMLTAGTVHEQATFIQNGEQVWSATAELELALDSHALRTTQQIPGPATVHIVEVDGIGYLSNAAGDEAFYQQVDLSDPADAAASTVTSITSALNPYRTMSALLPTAQVERIGGPFEQGEDLLQNYRVRSGAEEYHYTIDLIDNLPRFMSRQGADGLFEATFSGWGEPVLVSAPPAEQIAG